MNANSLKLLMMGLMVLDHISYFIPPSWALIFHVITRCVGVFFGYMAVEGFKYTRNVYRYAGRLYIWALIMIIGNHIINHILNNPLVTVDNNIFLTLALGISLLMCIKKVKESDKLIIKTFYLSAILLLLGIGVLFSEGGPVILPFMLITYLTKGKLYIRNILYIIFSIFLLVTNFQWLGNWTSTLEMLAFNSDFMFIIVLPFLYLYNGKRGKKSLFNKYFFYIFYPLHLWIITVLANCFQ